MHNKHFGEVRKKKRVWKKKHKKIWKKMPFTRKAKQLNCKGVDLK